MHVLLIDDDATLSGMLVKYLASEGIRTTSILSGSEGVPAALSGQYDAVILDIMMPGIDGKEVLRRIRAKSQIPVLMLSAKGSDVDRVVGLELGADDYMTKPHFPRELVARLKAVTRRQRLTDHTRESHAIRLGALEMYPSRREIKWSGESIDLTSSEFEMLECLLQAGDDVSSKEDLSLRVLGKVRASYDRGVDIHVSNLRRKLTQKTDGNIEIENIRGVGYRLKCHS